MVDSARILSKLDELERYLAELRSIVPGTLDAYRDLRTKRACERLIQVCVECALDVCGLLVAGLRLGLPGEEDDLLSRIETSGRVREETVRNLRGMKGLRNLLVHGYGGIEDPIVFRLLTERLGDLDGFASDVRAAIARPD